MLSGVWRDRKLGSGTDGRKLYDQWRIYNALERAYPTAITTAEIAKRAGLRFEEVENAWFNIV